MIYNRRSFIAADVRCFLLLGLMGSQFALTTRFCRAQIAPPAAGDFGGAGPYSVAVSTFTNPVYPTANGETLTVSVYHPSGGVNTTLPTVFFAHGYTSPIGTASSYDTLLTNLASQGYNVVFSPYEGGTGLNIAKRFDELTTGFDAAVAMYGLNTAKVGFAGHSYGGGFLPAVVQHEMMGVTDFSGTPGHTWGAAGAFMYSMAPGYAYGGLPASQIISLPANLNLVEQIYFDDTTIADPRVAIDVFYNSTVPNSQKDFMTVFGDDYGTPTQVANHFLPTIGTESTGLQAWGVFRHLDALAAYTFTGDLTAKDIALGNGSPAEAYMGKWNDGTPVTPLSATDLPDPAGYFAGAYVVDWDSAANPRHDFLMVPDPTPLGDYNRNGAVDAADYILWRHTLNPNSTGLADGNHNNQVDIGDYDIWRAHYGETAGAATGTNFRAEMALPEPSCGILLVSCRLALLLRRRSGANSLF